jgi:2-hydroxy-3-keto-5-methylthiopentenyl-1-phosphate phosphatase
MTTALDDLGSKVFVTDFDGTLTAVDFFDVVLEHVPTDTMPDYWGDCVAGRLTHVAALNGIFQHAPRDLATIEGWLPETRLDPQTPQGLRALRAAGWDIVVVSAGSEWYIHRILADVRDLVHIIANPGGFSEEQGLWMTWPDRDLPWHDPHFGVDKAKIVRQLLDAGKTVAFAGDGRPDLAAIRQPPAPLRFARGWLSDTLTAEGLDHHPFERWSEIPPVLLAGG